MHMLHHFAEHLPACDTLREDNSNSSCMSAASGLGKKSSAQQLGHLRSVNSFASWQSIVAGAAAESADSGLFQRPQTPNICRTVNGAEPGSRWARTMPAH